MKMDLSSPASYIKSEGRIPKKGTFVHTYLKGYDT